MLEQVFEHGELGGHLGTADDGEQRAFRIVEQLGGGFHFSEHERSGHGHGGLAQRAFGGCLSTMGRAERVHHVDVAHGGVLGGQLFAVLLFALEEAHVLAQHHLAGLAFHALQRFGAEFHGHAEQLAHVGGHGTQRELFFKHALGGAAQMREQDDARTRVQGLPDGGQHGADALVAGDDAVMDGNIHVHAHDNALALHVHIVHGQCFHRFSPFLTAVQEPAAQCFLP